MRHLDRTVRVSFSLGKERKTIGLREEDAGGEVFFCRKDRNRGCYFAVTVIFYLGVPRYNKCMKGKRSVAVRGALQ